MRVIHKIKEMKTLIRENRRQGKTIGLVPTMGYLHQGHQELMATARKKTDFVVVSIFVNPLQFGVGEDYEVYPRDLNRDSQLAEAAGVGVVFAPSVKDMYPLGYHSFVEVEEVTGKLCGKSRPGHFRGVTTVVNKLFNIVEPDVAFFGQKDAQQAIVLQKMVEDLNINVQIETVPIVREADGLALSSRNAYLDPGERKAALILSKSLNHARELIKSGETNAQHLKNVIIEDISQEAKAKIDYVEILSIPTLEEIEKVDSPALIAVAVFIGRTRLIDNLMLGA